MSEQYRFSQALLNPQAPLPEGCSSWNGSDPLQRFAVYRNNVIVGLIEALAASFDVTRQLVGETFFRAMAAEYARQEPPTSPVLAHYGAGFPAFIRQFPPAASLPYLADLAQLEWYRVCAFHAADRPPIAPQALQQQLADAERLPNLRAVLHPSLHVLGSPYAILSIWAAHQGQGRLAEVHIDAPEQVLILRPELEVELRRLAPADALFVEQLAQGATLGQALEQAASGDSFDPGPVLALMIRLNALCALEPPIAEEINR